MKKALWLLLVAMLATGLQAKEYNYVWGTEYPNYKSQIPPSDFVTNDGAFRFTTDKADGESGPQFGEDNKAGLLLRLYADNTLRIESLTGEKITAITFVIGGNGHYKLANLTPSVGQMGDPYLGNDATGKFREYRLFWTGSTADVTFTVGHECQYGIDCLEQGKEGEPGTCMTKQIIITTAATEALEQATDQLAPNTRKVMMDGTLYIATPDGKIYNATGAEVK